MEAKGVILDSVMEELENQSPISPETPTELDSSLDIALSLEASGNAAQGRCSYKSYAETSNHSNSAAQGCEQGSSLPEWSNEARSVVSSLPLLRDASCQVIDNDFSKYGQIYTRRSKRFNQNAAKQRRSPDDDLNGNTDPGSSQRKPNSTLKRNRTTYAPMPDQSKLSPEIKPSSSTEHQQYLEQKNQVAAKRVASKKNRDKAPLGSSANGEDSSFVENHIPDNRSSRRLDPDRAMQQKPCKKKHRPKVVTEDTSKRPPKPHTSKPTNPTEDPQTGRSYETRKRTKLTTPTRPSKVVNLKKRNSVITSSKRKLNFSKAEHVERGGSFPRHTVFKEEETVNEEPNEVATIEESKTRAVMAASSQVIEGVLTRYQKRRMAAQAMEGCNRESSSTAHLFGARSMKSSIKTSRPIHGKRKRKRTFSILVDKSKNFSATHGALCAPKNLFFGNGEINRMVNNLFPEILKKKRTERIQRLTKSFASSSTTTFKDVGSMPLNLDGPRGHSKADSLRNKQRQKYTHMKVVVAENPQGCTQTLAVYTSGPPAAKKRSRTREISRVTCPEENALVPYRANGEIEASSIQKQNAIVLHKKDGTLVPYEGPLAPVKKRRQRAQVDLDEETTRVWNLLLEGNDDDGVDGSDEDKEKWWQEERRVFHGRVHSFIARMRLIQGDRRFSPWKGSVVDSVVGVFLTQNVSDHLSSFAFMSLASRYPFKPRKEAEMQHESTSAPAEDPTLHLGGEQVGDTSMDRGVDIESHGGNIVEMVYGEGTSAENSAAKGENSATEQSDLTTEWATQSPLQDNTSEKSQKQPSPAENGCSSYILEEGRMVLHSAGPSETTPRPVHEEGSSVNKTATLCESESIAKGHDDMLVLGHITIGTASKIANIDDEKAAKQVKAKAVKGEKTSFDWDTLRKQAEVNGKRERTSHNMDSVDYEAVRNANVEEIAQTIKIRGMNNRIAERIQEFLNRMDKNHGSIDLEWLRDIAPDKTNKKFRMFLRQVGVLKVDTNVGRVAVRLGWVPLQPLPESLQLHLLEMYELHYHMITFGKVFCTKKKPNCNACPLRAECRHFASAFASARLALPGPEEKTIVASTKCGEAHQDTQVVINPAALFLPQASEYSKSTPCDIACQDSQETINPLLQASQPSKAKVTRCDPIIEVPNSPEPEQRQQTEMELSDMEDIFKDDPNEIPTINLNLKDFAETLGNYMQVQPSDISKALVTITVGAACIPTPKLKNVNRLRTEHHVYALPDTHPLLNGVKLQTLSNLRSKDAAVKNLANSVIMKHALTAIANEKQVAKLFEEPFW
ncbi:ROS1A-like protein [Drosera capensis]